MWPTALYSMWFQGMHVWQSQVDPWHHLSLFEKQCARLWKTQSKSYAIKGWEYQDDRIVNIRLKYFKCI